MNTITKTLAAVTLGFAALGAQAGEVATGDLQAQRTAASSTVAASAPVAAVAGVSGEVAAGDLGLRAVNRGTAPAVTLVGGRIESRFAIGA
jgi:hypothetical protein